jgi:lia operon protein LiaI
MNDISYPKGGEPMKLQSKNTLALILIACGALILFGKFGLMFGWLASLIVPLVLIGFGYLGLKNGRTLIGGILVFFGAIMLVGRLTPLIGWIVAILLIGYGLSLLTKKKSY